MTIPQAGLPAGTARPAARRPHTLRNRLALLALATTALWVIALTVAFNIALSARLRHQADDLLRTRATAVAATVQTHTDGSLTVREPDDGRVDDQILDTGVWIYRGPRLIEGPAGPHAAPDALARRTRSAARTGTWGDTRLYAMPLTDGSRTVGTVVTSVSLDPYRSTTRTVLAASTALVVLLLGGVYTVTRAGVGRALRPVADMTAQATRWSEHGATERFGSTHHPAELTALAGSLDHLLDHLAAVLRHERQQTADLSHELRTPLARITAEADWLTVKPRDQAEQCASHTSIAEAAGAMRRICDSLLDEARTRTGQLPGRCELPALARDLAERTGRTRPQGPLITVQADVDTAPPLIAGVSAAVAERVLTPLLDNALRYADCALSIRCAREAPGTVTVTVTDDGPGVPDAFVADLFEPGRRADPSDGHDGAGLGLALARRLARAAGGDIALADATGRPGSDDRSAGANGGGRGAAFSVTLPAG